MPSKWQLLTAVEKSRVPLGMKSTTITVLRALLTFIPHDKISQEACETHLCFASNTTLAERCHVSVQTVERHISKLVSLGLLTRATMGNGKRWARRNHHGQIVRISGLSLLPLLERFRELLDLSAAYAQSRQALLALRDRVLDALAQLREVPSKTAAFQGLQSTAKQLLRRRPDETALAGLLDEIRREVRHNNMPKTTKMRGNTPKNEGHKEPEINRSVKDKNSVSCSFTPDQMERAYPRLCSALRTERTSSSCQTRMDTIAKQIAMSSVWTEVRAHGPTVSFMILGYVLERVESLRSPGAYVAGLLGLLERKELKLETLLIRPKASTKQNRNGPQGTSMRRTLDTAYQILELPPA